MERAFDGEKLRALMRHVPSPVTVITAALGSEKRGITIGSFTSTSLDPPLITFNLARDAQMYPLMLEADRFVVHVMAEHQAQIANNFSIGDSTSEEQFAGIDHSLDEHGTPVLDEALSTIFCRKHAVYDAGDHVIVVGEVIEIEDAVEVRPLVYYGRSYHQIGSIADATLFDPVQEGMSRGD